MNDKLVICSQCEEEIKEGEYYLIFQLVANTPEKQYTIGLNTVLSELNEYILNKFYHLSASEIILLRPDIVLEFLRERYEKEIINWELKIDYICRGECYEVYKEVMPLV